MQALLAALKARLITLLAGDVRESDVYITTNGNVIPTGVMFPCVGIKDGKIDRQELACNMIEETLAVEVVAFVGLAKPEATIMGDASTGQPGVLEIIDTIREGLVGDLLELAGMTRAWPGDEAESEMFVTEQGATLQKKTITMLYERERLQ